MMTRVAVLGNGPSRESFNFNDSARYEYLIGCNIPWTRVDSTVILDHGVVQYWYKQKLPNVPTWFSENAWRETRFTDRKYFENHFLGLVKPLPEYDTSAHVACSKLIELGYKHIDIYGCDSWFKDDTESFTHRFVDSRSTDISKHPQGWRNRWKSIIEGTDAIVNFIE